MSGKSWERCPHRKDDGERCGCRTRLNPETGLCVWHDPEREEQRRQMQRQGGKATAAKRRPDGLLPEELPPLESHEDAQRWLDRVGRAVATGRIDNRDANSVVRAVEAWIKAEAERLGADAVHELRERLETLEADVGGTVRGIS